MACNSSNCYHQEAYVLYHTMKKGYFNNRFDCAVFSPYDASWWLSKEDAEYIRKTIINSEFYVIKIMSITYKVEE